MPVVSRPVNRLLAECVALANAPNTCLGLFPAETDPTGISGSSHPPLTIPTDSFRIRLLQVDPYNPSHRSYPY